MGPPNSDKPTATVWVTAELFECMPQTEAVTGETPAYPLHVGTGRFPVGILPYVAHRPHAVPSSIHLAVEGGHWWPSLAAEDPDVRIPGQTVDATTEQIAEDLRHLSPDPLAERTRGGDRGVAQPLTTSDGQVVDLQLAQKAR